MIIASSLIVPCKHGANPICNGAIAVKRGIIAASGPVAAIVKQFPRDHIYELKNAAILPGLVNLHTHLELPPLLDVIRTKTFPDWVLNLIHAKKNLRKSDFSFAAKNNINGLIQTGTTTVGEICTHDVSVDPIRKSGLRSIVYHEIINMGTGGRGWRSKIQKKGRNYGLVQQGLAPHSPYTVSETVLGHILKSIKKNKTKLCMHIAESKDEIGLLQRKKSGLEKLYKFADWDPAWAPEGSSSFEYLYRKGFLVPNLLAVHAVNITDNDIVLMKKSEVSIAHCPRSNKEIGVGRMPLKKILNAGIPVGLGTDSLASSPSLNMWDEMRYAYKIHKRDGVTEKDIFTLATIGGAKALGMHKDIGTLEPGKKADLIIVRLPKKDTGDIYSDLLRETKSCIMSMVNGKIIYSDVDYGR
jgi:aminodeoxyfutalosine deaminase